MTPAQEIRVLLPASGSLLGFCRLAASAAAASIDFDVDDLDDLRTAVGEAVGLLLEGVGPPAAPPLSQLELHISLHDDSIEIVGALEGATLPAGTESDLTHALLAATTDDYSFDQQLGRRSFRVVKQRTSS